MSPEDIGDSRPIAEWIGEQRKELQTFWVRAFCRRGERGRSVGSGEGGKLWMRGWAASFGCAQGPLKSCPFKTDGFGIRLKAFAPELLPAAELRVAGGGARFRGGSWNCSERGVAVEPASVLIDEKIKELGDWRGKTLAKVRGILHEADPEIVEEWKWRGTPVWSHGGIVCTGETYKSVVKMTFAKGAALEDPSGLFNSSLEGNVRRAIDIHEGDRVDAAALKELIRAAVAANLAGKSKGKAGGKRAG
jgi:hypothetical protein